MQNKILIHGLGLSWLALGVILSIYNFNISIVFIIIGSFFLQKFSIIEYSILAVMLIIKTQSESIISSEDFIGYIQVYNDISIGKIQFDEAFTSGEYILPLFFKLSSFYISSVDQTTLSFIFTCLFLLLFYPIINVFKDIPVVSVAMLIFVDSTLLIHLFRQNISSLVLLIVLIFPLNKNRYKIVAIFYTLLAGFIHLTSFVFASVLLMFSRISINHLKVILLISLFIGSIFLQKNNFQDLLSAISAYPILGKASYALNTLDSDSGIRVVAYISIIMSFFVKNESNLMKAYYVFAILGLLFVSLPIIGPRIGLISTSILTGMPIGLFLWNLKNILLRMITKKEFYAKTRTS